MASQPKTITFTLTGFNCVALICAMTDLGQALLYSIFFYLVNAFTSKKASSPPGSNPWHSEHIVGPTGTLYPLRNGGDPEDWFWSLTMIGAQVFCLTLGLWKLLQAMRNNVTFQELQKATKHWILLKCCFIFVAIIAGLDNPLQFYVPGCILSYTLVINLSLLFVIMAMYTHKRKQNEDAVLPK